jgi:tRNA pseudouridine55 synthase
LYHYARRGISIEKESREVAIHHLEWLDQRSCIDILEPSLTIKVTCSKGTYIRTLAADIGDAIGCGAYLSTLRRTRSGFFSVKDSVPGSALETTGSNELIYKSILSVENVQNLLQ